MALAATAAAVLLGEESIGMHRATRHWILKLQI